MRVLKAICLLSLAAVPSLSPAADRMVPVHFARGTNSQAIKGTIRGYDGVDYTLSAKAGQTMRVDFKTGNGSAYINILAPGADQALFDGSISGNHFSAKLPSSGTYKVQVYMMRNAAWRNETASYNLRISVNG